MRREIKNTKRGFAKQLIIFGVLVSFLAGAFLTIETVSFGAELTKLQSDEAVLISQNRDLSEKIARSSSTTSLEAKAAATGFVSPEKIVYVTGLSQVASKLP